MRLTKAGYYADFFVYPPIMVTVAAVGLRAPTSLVLLRWTTAWVAGIAGWTLIEYLFHRFVLHQFPYLAQMHDMHHARPNAFVGTPTWLSLPAILTGAFLPLWWEGDFAIASGLTSGVMLGYLAYVVAHHGFHHWRIDSSSFLYELKLRHAQHHHGGVSGNFGVTTAFWDRVFGTAIDRRRRRAT